ncbi:MAG: hypothetical protein R2706_20605 [Acidimicrobiales bacterium]
MTARSSLVSLANLAYLCDTDVAMLGKRPCLSSETTTDVSRPTWLAATTGPLQLGAPAFPPSEEGGVGWTNREAQSYRPDLVRMSGDTIELVAIANQSQAPCRYRSRAAWLWARKRSDSAG